MGSQSKRAAMWTGSALSFADLHPTPGSGASEVQGIGGGQQGGWYLNSDGYSPALWSGSAASFVNLMPDVGPGPAQEGQVFGVAGGKQAGYVVQFPGSSPVASLWSGSADSWVNLNPEGSTWSTARGIGGNQQVGVARFGSDFNRAALWTGTADSYVDLHPNVLNMQTSSLSYTDGVQQVGNVVNPQSGESNASVWSGTADSWVNLHPGIGVRSFATAVSDGYQVGMIQFNPVDNLSRNAGFWNGSADSWFNLHSFLSDDYTSSEAQGIFVAGNAIFISGTAYNGVEQRNEAVVWVGIIPSPSGVMLFGVAGVVAAGWRRRG